MPAAAVVCDVLLVSAFIHPCNPDGFACRPSAFTLRLSTNWALVIPACTARYSAEFIPHAIVGQQDVLPMTPTCSDMVSADELNTLLQKFSALYYHSL